MKRQIFIMYKHNPIWFVLDQNLPSKLKISFIIRHKVTKKNQKTIPISVRSSTFLPMSVSALFYGY